MPYILYKTNGSRLTVVEDAALDLTTSLTFVGKNYAGYGQIIDQDLVKLLENFANVTPPPRPIVGQMWYDSANQKLKVYTPTAFKTLSNIEMSSSRPTHLTAGDLWFNTSTKKLYVKVDSSEQFSLVGPTDSTITGSRIEPAIIKDNTGADKVILRHLIKDEVIAITSKEDFIPMDDIGFPIVKAGINLIHADATTGNSANTGHYFWGTAKHAERLGNYTADDFVLKTQNSTSTFYTEVDIINDGGIVVGDDQFFRIHANSSANRAILSSTLADHPLDFNLMIGSTLTTVLALSGSSLSSPASINLGNSLSKFNTVYASNLTGALVDPTVVFNGGSIATTTSEFKLSSAASKTKLVLSTDNSSGLIVLGNNAITVSNNSLATLSSPTVVAHTTLPADARSTSNVGYRDIPQFRLMYNLPITLALTDRGGHVLLTQSGVSVTVPASGDVAFPIGSSITLVNISAGAISILRGSGVTLTAAGVGGNADRTLGSNGVATLLKVDVNTWFVAGVALS